MVEDLDINISTNISKYFWEKLSSGNIDITNGEFGISIIFFSALPDDIYDLIEKDGATKGKVKPIIDQSEGGVTGCSILKINGSPVHIDAYAYPIFEEAGEDGFYIVMYDRDNNVTIKNPITDIVAICKNLIVKLDENEHIIKGFIIQTNNNSDASKDDYLLAYSKFTSPVVMSNQLVFTRNTKIVNVGKCTSNIL